MRSIATRTVALPGDRDGAELTCLEIAGSGAPFLLLHGLTGHRDDFGTVLSELSRDNLAHWVAPDLRGHGDFTHTGRDDTFTFAQLNRDMLGLLDALGAERCDLLGHSFGGMVVQRFALAHPERVRSLFLMSTAPDPPEGYDASVFEKAGAIARERGMAFLQDLVEKAARQDPDPSPSDLQTRKWAERYWPHQVRRYRAMDPVAYGALGLLMVNQRPLTADLSAIRCPTTIVVGDEDPGFLAGSRALARAIPDAELITIPDAGHHPHMENPERWFEAIRGHLAAVEEAAA